MRNGIFIAASLLVFAIFNLGILRNERILGQGEIIFLELAPADPRSLMQGDYMQLAYAIGRGRNLEQSHGRIVVRADENQVARFVRFHAGETPARDEKLLRYRSDWRGVRILPDSFFFQEGHAPLYAAAKYGVFRFDGAKNYLLAGLADENQHIIQPEQ